MGWQDVKIQLLANHHNLKWSKNKTNKKHHHLQQQQQQKRIEGNERVTVDKY